jgi:hypothetical protein
VLLHSSSITPYLKKKRRVLVSYFNRKKKYCDCEESGHETCIFKDYPNLNPKDAFYCSDVMKSIFFRKIAENVDVWENVSDHSIRRRLEGLAFSFVTMLDGSDFREPIYYLVPSTIKSLVEQAIQENELTYPCLDCVLQTIPHFGGPEMHAEIYEYLLDGNEADDSLEEDAYSEIDAMVLAYGIENFVEFFGVFASCILDGITFEEGVKAISNKRNMIEISEAESLLKKGLELFAMLKIHGATKVLTRYRANNRGRNLEIIGALNKRLSKKLNMLINAIEDKY